MAVIVPTIQSETVLSIRLQSDFAWF